MADELDLPETLPDDVASETATAIAENPDAPAPLLQEVVITDAGPCKKHVKVTVDRAAIDARLDEKYSELVMNSPTNVPGFRPGKAPRKVIVRKYSKEVTSEVKTEVLMASLEQLATEQTLSPLSPPELDPESVVIPEFGPMIYEFDIEVRPEFDLPNYKSLKIRRPSHTFTDADVAKEAKRMLEPYGQVVAKDGAIALDDLIVADVAFKRGDKVLNTLPGIKFKVEKRLALADGVAENFGDQLSGAKVGDVRTIDIKLSEEIATEGLRGTNVLADVTIKEIKQVNTPALSPEILEAFEVRTEDQFHELVRTRLERYLTYIQRQTARAQVLEILAGSNNWDLPRDLLVRQARKTLSRKVMEMRSSGMTDDQINGRRRVLEQDAIKNTAAALKEHFVLQKIAETEKLEIEDADIEAEIERIADQNGESYRKVKARMEKDDLIEALATELLERKALDLVLDTAEYDDYEMNPAETDTGEVGTSDAAVDADATAAPADSPTS